MVKVREMKKIILLLMLFTTGAFATEMCARNDTVVVVLDAAELQTGSGYNSIDMLTFSVFEYGRVTVGYACLTEKEIKSYSYSYTGNLGQGMLLDTREYNLWGLYGEDTDPEPRIFCACKVMHPVSSKWFVRRNLATASTCRSSCYVTCMDLFRDSHIARETMYKSIGI